MWISLLNPTYLIKTNLFQILLFSFIILQDFRTGIKTWWVWLTKDIHREWRFLLALLFTSLLRLYFWKWLSSLSSFYDLVGMRLLDSSLMVRFLMRPRYISEIICRIRFLSRWLNWLGKSASLFSCLISIIV